MPGRGLVFVWLLVDLLLRVRETSLWGSRHSCLSELSLETFTIMCWRKVMPRLGTGDAERDHAVPALEPGP